MWAWMKRQWQALTADRPLQETGRTRPLSGRADPSETALSRARDILLHNGPEAALNFLKDSPYVGTEPVIRLLHALVWAHYRTLSRELLDAPFLDPIWCQCTMCDQTWLISPLLAQAPVDPSQASQTGCECVVCARALCRQCASAAGDRCLCGGAWAELRRPNGRKRLQHLTPADTLSPELLAFPSDLPLPPDSELHLYFGVEGSVPIGVDPTFPTRQTASVEAHLTWAETLMDAGLFYQAQQQLEGLPNAALMSARACWLQARLTLIRLRNAFERQRRHASPLPEVYRDWHTQILTWLEAATQQSPAMGPAWLLRTQLALDPCFEQDYPRAVLYARCARAQLGDAPAVLLALGEALWGDDQVDEAVAVLRQIPEDTVESTLAKQTLQFAELAVRCHGEPVDVDAHLRLGRLYIRHEQLDKAWFTFTRLVEHTPERAEGYYGLAQLASMGFPDLDKPMRVQILEAHRLCREALKRNPAFGLAYELLACIVRNLHFDRSSVDEPVENPLTSCRRALQYDATCDKALWMLAEDALKQGQLQPALGLLEQAAALDTDVLSVYSILAVLYKGTRQFDKIAWAQQKAKALAPHLRLSEDYEQKLLQLCGFEW